MNTFFKYVQPTIVKTSDDKHLRKDMRNMYLVNYNVFGIEYFSDNYFIMEDEEGNLYYRDKDYIDPRWIEIPDTGEDSMKDDDDSSEDDSSYEGNAPIILEDDEPDDDEFTFDAFNLDLESSNLVKVLDLPRLYIKITPKFMNDYAKIFQYFICKAIEKNEIYVTGIEGFRPGEDYFLNKTLYDYLYSSGIGQPPTNSLMPDYLEPVEVNEEGKDVRLTIYWWDRTGDEDENYTEFEYFYNKNQATLNQKFEDEQLKNFYSTFCQTILDYTLIDDELRSEQINQIYDLVLKYFANFSSDCASTAISLVLNSLYSTSSSKSGCSCNSSCDSSMNLFSSFNNPNNGSIEYQTKTCFNLYQEAMIEYLKKMLGDSGFYKDWFFTDINEAKKIPNTGMIELLEILLNEFLSKNWDISFSTKSNDCTCPTLYESDSECNRNIIKNYLNVLNWVKQDQIDENRNKIKIFGSQFGELLPMLQL